MPEEQGSEREMPTTPIQEGVMPDAEIPPASTESDVVNFGMIPEAKLPPAPPSQPQPPAPEGKDGSAKK